MRYFVNYDKTRYKLDVPPDKEVRWIKQLLRGKIGSNTGEKFVLHHGRIELQDDWMLSKLVCSIPPGSIIHCKICKNRLDIEVELNYSSKRHSIMEEFNQADTIHKLKCEIQYSLGLPVSSFTLYFGSLKMYDNQKLDEFNINAPAIITLTSWKGWDKFLWCATEGRTKQLAGSMEKEVHSVYKYQQRVALFIAAHYNHVDMASSLLQQGVSCSEPVGDHPSELWREPLQKHHPELTTPIFHAAAKGNLDILRLFLETKPDLMISVDTQEHTLIDVALKHKHVKCVEYMKTVKLRNRSRGSTAFRRYGYIFKLIVRLVHWRKIASLRLKPYKLSKQKTITMIANMCITDDIHNNRLMRPERNNLQINKPEYHEHPTDHQTLASPFTSCDSKPPVTSYLHHTKNCFSNNTSLTGCELPAILSLPSISSSSVFSGASSSTSALVMTSPLSKNKDGQQQILPQIRDSMSPIDRSRSIPTIRVKKYDKFLFDKQQYNRVYGEKVLNNQSLYSLALRCMETASLSCQKKSWMQQLQMAVSLGKSNVIHPK